MTQFPIQLHDGSISSFIARIPWSNLLYDNLGCSLHSIHLTFHVIPSTPDDRLQPGINLADSISSVAESFLHQEEAALHESLNPNLSSSIWPRADGEGTIPGGLDPFLSMDDDGFHSDSTRGSVFDSLIKRILNNLEFDATDTKFTFVHPGHSSFTVSIPEIRRGKDTGDGQMKSTTDNPTSSSGTGTLTISGITVTTQNLCPLVLLPSSPTASTLSPVSLNTPSRFSPPPHPPPPSSSSSSSSIDEETQFMMSQSIVSLPPRHPSPPGSVTSDLYQNPIPEHPNAADESLGRSRSNTPLAGDGSQPGSNDSECPQSELLPNPTLDDQKTSGSFEPSQEMILSFGTEPIVIHWIFPTNALPDTSLPDSYPTPPSDVVQVDDKLQASVAIGVLSIALHARHVRSLIDLVDIMGSHQPSQRPEPNVSDPSSRNPANPSTSMLGPAVALNLKLRGAVLILWSHIDDTVEPTTSEPLADFFAHPLVPPRLNHGYVRAHVEALSLSLTSSASQPAKNEMKRERPAGVRGRTRRESTVTTTLELAVTDISVIAIHAVPNASLESTILNASPILITDHHLPSQYQLAHPGTGTSEDNNLNTHPQLPTFDVTDWTNERHQKNGVKLSMWRTRIRPKPNNQTRRESRLGATPRELPANAFVEDEQQDKKPVTSAPAIRLTITRAESSSTAGTKTRTKTTQLVELKSVPWHVFLNLGLADDVLAFLNQISASREKESLAEEIGIYEDSSSSEEEFHTSPVEPGAIDSKAREKERRRLEKLVLNDLDLDLDYRKKEPTSRSRRKVGEYSSLHLLTLTMLDFNFDSMPKARRRS